MPAVSGTSIASRPARTGRPRISTSALDEVGGPGLDESISISPDGAWLALGVARFDPECAGWPCLSVAPADLSTGEAVHVDGAAVHPEGWGVVAAGGDLVVYPISGGPHALDLWAITRNDSGWSSPALLTADSSFAYNHTAALSADGTRVLFDCGDEPYAGAGSGICEVGTDGSGLRTVAMPADGPAGSPLDGALHHADYEPDGGIVFQASWDGALWRVPADGGVPQRVGPAAVGDGAPCVLSDGRIASIWSGRPGSDGTPDLEDHDARRQRLRRAGPGRAPRGHRLRRMRRRQHHPGRPLSGSPERQTDGGTAAEGSRSREPGPSCVTRYRGSVRTTDDVPMGLPAPSVGSSGRVRPWPRAWTSPCSYQRWWTSGRASSS